MQNIGATGGTQQRGGTQHFVATPSELEARWRAPAFTKDILPIVGIGKLDLSTPFHAIMLCPQLPVPRFGRDHPGSSTTLILHPPTNFSIVGISAGMG